MPPLSSPSTPHTALQQAWHQHRLWLTAMMQQPIRLAGQCLREDAGQSGYYRRLMLRLFADQAALGYDAIDLLQHYETVWQDWPGPYAAPLDQHWWQWRQRQHKRQQRLLLTLTRSTLQYCQLQLASEQQASRRRAMAG